MFMKRLLSAALPVLILLGAHSASAVNSVSGTHNGLFHTLQTDSELYVLGEFVEVCYSVENVTSDPIQLGHPQCMCPVWVTIFASPDSVVWCNPCGCMDEYCSDTLDPGESYVKEFTWDMENYWTGGLIETRGIHRFNGRLQVHPYEYQYELDLSVAIVEDAAGLPEFEEERTWCAIKALYR